MSHRLQDVHGILYSAFQVQVTLTHSPVHALTVSTTRSTVHRLDLQRGYTRKIRSTLQVARSTKHSCTQPPSGTFNLVSTNQRDRGLLNWYVSCYCMWPCPCLGRAPSPISSFPVGMSPAIACGRSYPAGALPYLPSLPLQPHSCTLHSTGMHLGTVAITRLHAHAHLHPQACQYTPHLLTHPRGGFFFGYWHTVCHCCRWSLTPPTERPSSSRLW
jgi:hypothetical protein